jgi:hypothetical protein
MARRDPTKRLNNVDLPTLGRPTMATVDMPDGATMPTFALDISSFISPAR